MLKKIFLFVLVLGAAAGGAAAVFIYATLPNVGLLKAENPKTTALIAQRIREAQERGQQLRVRMVWVSFESIPERLKEAVRIAEDARFYEHDGIDYEELQEAIRKNIEKGALVRGASTITQQLAKNLYLSTDRDFIRKLREFFIARQLEDQLSKSRIFHIYLNVIEFGPGIFGVEAAARHYFGKGAAQLDLEEIVRLTAVVPRPLLEQPTRNSRWLKWRAGWILSMLRKTGRISPAEFQAEISKFR
jgi:monofunctional biosynthetic peptidoglycan transglycosylase